MCKQTSKSFVKLATCSLHSFCVCLFACSFLFVCLLFVCFVCLLVFCCLFFVFFYKTLDASQKRKVGFFLVSFYFYFFKADSATLSCISFHCMESASRHIYVFLLFTFLKQILHILPLAHSTFFAVTQV